MNEVLYACWVAILVFKNRFKGKNFLPGLRPEPRIEHPSLDAPPRRPGGLVAAQSAMPGPQTQHKGTVYVLTYLLSAG